MNQNSNNNNNTTSRYNSIPSISHTLSNTSTSTSAAGAVGAAAGSKRKSSSGFSLANFDNPLPADQQYPNSASSSSSSSTSHPQPSTNIQNNEVHNSTHTQVQVQPHTQTDSNSYRSLNVKDALSYLEQVKLQFNSKPYIYNQFLDIMKDFKSQNIDTPGVIERVSNLFKGYPILIQGFNTFLPQGYRIDCTNNPDDPIKVTTPLDSTSTVISSFTSTLQPPPISQYSSNQHVHVQSNQLPLPTPVVPSSSTIPPTVAPPPPPPSSSPPPPPTTTTIKKPNDIEFSQAINYVNKIKNRFANQPEVYKNFLEILQTYQREQKPINEVYSQVTILFQNAPDLLEDFKKFLPDSTISDQPTHLQISQRQQQQQRTGAYSNGNYLYNGVSTYYPSGSSQNGTPGPSSFNIQRKQQQQQQQNLPPIGSFSPPSNGTNGSLQDEHKNTESQQQQQQQQPGQVVGLPPIVTNDQTLDDTSASLHNQYVNTTQMTNDNLQISNLRDTNGPINNQIEYPTQQQQQLQQQLQLQQQIIMEDQLPVRPEIDLDPSIVPVVPEPTEPIEDNLTLMEETTFFEKAKKFIGNKQVYTEFLKVLNLFSQDIIDINELVDKVENFLGGQPDLFNWFKNFVGYQDKPKIIENIVHEKHKLDLDLCEAYGPSYKKLPKTDTYMPCSGRDDMCWQVLNDEWVGHPVWASEDSGFIAHRKNQYEETLFKIEEERHEYDYYIESNLRTIQTLETIANRIANMTPEEKKNFKLPPGLGHTSLTIYKKVIRKVYDKERGFEIIDALHEHPAITVPVVLKRLKQKDEEWRRAQREWNKVWRELEQKVYFKSLDHLGLTFKQADKKLLTTKQLVSEISSIKVDQNNKRMHWLTPKPKSQLDYQFNDFDIFYDIIRLADIFIDHSSTYSNPDKLRLKDFLRTVISLFFFIPVHTINDAIKERSKIDDQDDASSYKDIDESNQHDDSKVKRSRDDVELSLSDILHKAKYQKLKNSSKENDSEGITEDEAEKLAKEADLLNEQEAKRPWLLGSMIDTADSCGAIANRKIFNMFANTNIYIFFRHWTAIYTRLHEIKDMNEKVTREINSRKVVQFAVDLNLLSTQLKDMGLDFTGKDSYQEVLSMSKRLIENKLEHQWFEESLRQAFNNKAFKMYTVDKVIQSLVKHLHSLMADSKTSEIMLLFEKDRHSLSTSTKDQLLYRLQTRSHMSSVENMFRIEYNKDTRHVCIQYIALDDLTLNTKRASDTDKWKYYITSYSLPHPTEGIDQDKLYAPFLERILDFENEALDVEDPANSKYSPEGVSHSILKIKISKATYAMEIEPGSYDVFSRKSMNKYPIKVNEIKSKKSLDKKIAIIDKFLSSKFGWRRGLEDTSIDSSTSDATTTEKSSFGDIPASPLVEKESISTVSKESSTAPMGDSSNDQAIATTSTQ